MDLRDEWMVSLCFSFGALAFFLKERFQQIVDPECNYPRLLKQPSLVTAALTAEPTDSERCEPSNRQVATKCRSRDWNQILPMSH